MTWTKKDLSAAVDMLRKNQVKCLRCGGDDGKGVFALKGKVEYFCGKCFREKQKS